MQSILLLLMQRPPKFATKLTAAHSFNFKTKINLCVLDNFIIIFFSVTIYNHSYETIKNVLKSVAIQFKFKFTTFSLSIKINFHPTTKIKKKNCFIQTYFDSFNFFFIHFFSKFIRILND